MNKDVLHKMLVDQMQVYTSGICPRLNPKLCGNKNIIDGKHITCSECFVNYIFEQFKNLDNGVRKNGK